MDLVGRQENIFLITLYLKENRELISAARSIESLILHYIKEAKQMSARKTKWMLLSKVEWM